MSGKNVLLTGGNGFIAVHILVLLLDRGYSVTATVRSESKTTYLRNKFSQAVDNGRLKFAIVPDITVSGAFDEVLKQSSFDAVLHTSSPFAFEVNDVTKDLLLPAINGTTEILKAAKAHAPTVKRVVVTSSFVSIVDGSKGDRPGYAYSEKDWNPVTFEKAQQNPYAGYYGSKTLAEKAAWKFVETEKPNFDLVTICPPLVHGPVLQEVTSLKALNTSSAQFYSIFNGEVKQLTNVGVWLWVDVRDVAKAHVAALEKPEAGGRRFLVSEGTFNVAQVADYIWKHYPDRAVEKGIPKDTSGAGYPPDGTYTSDNSASKSILGIEYLSFESTLKDQLAQFVALEEELEGKHGKKL
ncbi:methylglyoxal reductase (NADPH-dependent) gre2 [Ceratobasidium sp. 370]|nr:methylglyoxal reductase (NADPH-dependent) gre2 [Ceratobasidium sp. 370]